MLRPTVIRTKSGHDYFNAFGERFCLDEFYDDLELPFYACYIPTHHDNNVLVAAFQEKEDLIDWICAPLRKNILKKIVS